MKTFVKNFHEWGEAVHDMNGSFYDCFAYLNTDGKKASAAWGALDEAAMCTDTAADCLVWLNSAHDETLADILKYCGVAYHRLEKIAATE